ncbi:DUF1493 family protein [Flammeovirga sp. SJP92]|uniref:DUF1493 family protein n=1 Tax=Flammeovirga sp. SJP92 TaxID=1775430 RepID=UPI00078891FB|nr:DUF1493 family protein [Flammeovirga sp. SJP92]KXX70382.1 hypothetical protein AVL50_11645 [Flammeovirga sp. SJP92]
MNRKYLENDLKMFIESLININVDHKTVFIDDLGIDGLDAYIFMSELSKRYSINLTSFDPDDYFEQESDLFNILLLWNKCFNKKPKKQFSFQHIIRVIEKGEWFDPPMI